RYVHAGGTPAGVEGDPAIAGDSPGPEERPMELLVGGIFRIRGGLAFEAGGGPGITTGYGTPEWRVLLGVRMSRLTTDYDRDTLLDADDLCFADAEDRDGFEDGDGCPDPDNDRDGLADLVDKCPNTAEDHDGLADDDGCPEEDFDRDGLADAKDKCPDKAEDRDGFEDEDGCPEPDNDEDGIADAVDKCPLMPEVLNGYEDEDGCPDMGRAVLTATKIELTGRVMFDFKKARIMQESYPLLHDVAQILIQHPELKKIRIEGHADDVGTADYNLKLSRNRAAAVRDYLVDVEGVDPSRMEADGYGASRPLDQSDTDEARAKNRRVEFVIVKQGT
ncbi:MAG: OmpA family protein, partial [Myxococcota bacterium]